ncbi:alkylhydroperoxidase domain protein [Rubellimicrobium arenae]|uniref:alkylhydroperoxidase domain protein n=1 Tax=Rubellimicrobium arenae TaxID=2817372 RepID=UPI001B31847B|nr:alkylhydroperoxidase domain protein [Rubellimicrobium arenae]
MTDTVLSHPGNHEPDRFTTDNLGWLPWLPPLAEEELTQRHRDGLADPSRAKSPYFMLLAHDPEVLGARTRVDRDIFYNTQGGLPRADRELAATAVSRVNGCIFCASVHSRFAARHSRRETDVQALLDHGPTVPLGERWGAIVRSATALTATPPALAPENVDDLNREGLTAEEQVDLVLASAFFHWANRLMLSLGEPTAAGA